MNKKKLKEIAKQVARLEMESRKQDNNLKDVSVKIEDIIDTLSVEEIFQLDKYIRQEFKCC